MLRTASWLAVVALFLLSAGSNHPAAAAEPPRRFEFTRMIAHWAEYSDRAAYLSFVHDAQPEVAQIGFYGGHFWSLGHTVHGQGYPGHFPVVGLTECGDWFAELNSELHKRNVKAIGHFNVKFLVGDPDSPDGPRGFFKFYRDLWDEKLLGPKPVADARELLEINPDGTLIMANNYSIGGMKEYWGCLNNPHWRTVLKAWAKAGIDRGVDGYMINYFYRHNCLCQHCQREFKQHLTENFKPDELKAKFEIADLPNHKFSEIVSWHNPAESSPLRREMLRFSQVANKRAFDEVFVEYGRSLKPDLIVGQWNHLGNFNQISGDERCLLPTQLWGKDEDYLWYSSGGAAHYSDLPERFLGEVTLQARYIRGAFDDKPFTIGKYENTRIRMAISELAANGGAPMGFYTRFADPAARAEIVRYYRFMQRCDDVFKGNRPHSEAVLVYPRSQVHAGDLSALEAFQQIGKALLDQHLLFDIIPDELATDAVKARYRRVYQATAAEQQALTVPPEASRFNAPFTVRVSASRPAAGAERLHVHFVNYNRQEPKEKHSAGGGIVDEKPLAAPDIPCDLVLPAGKKSVKVSAVTPEAPEPRELTATLANGRLQFTVPGFLVYSVVQIELAD